MAVRLSKTAAFQDTMNAAAGVMIYSVEPGWKDQLEALVECSAKAKFLAGLAEARRRERHALFSKTQQASIVHYSAGSKLFVRWVCTTPECQYQSGFLGAFNVAEVHKSHKHG